MKDTIKIGSSLILGAGMMFAGGSLQADNEAVAAQVEKVDEHSIKVTTPVEQTITLTEVKQSLDALNVEKSNALAQCTKIGEDYDTKIATLEDIISKADKLGVK